MQIPPIQGKLYTVKSYQKLFPNSSTQSTDSTLLTRWHIHHWYVRWAGFRGSHFRFVVSRGPCFGNEIAKQTSTLIPLCHNITLDSSEINFRFLEEELQIVSIIRSEEKTGVEMEALTAATISALAIYDMVKGVDKSVYIKEIFLLEKKGGKTGDYTKNNHRKK